METIRKRTYPEFKWDTKMKMLLDHRLSALDSEIQQLKAASVSRGDIDEIKQILKDDFGYVEGPGGDLYKVGE